MNEPVEHSSSLLFQKYAPIASTQIENDMFWMVDWSTEEKDENGVSFNGCQGALSLISVRKQMHPVGQIQLRPQGYWLSAFNLRDLI